VSDAPPSPGRPTAAFPQCLSCRIFMRTLSAPRSFCASSLTKSTGAQSHCFLCQLAAPPARATRLRSSATARRAVARRPRVRSTITLRQLSSSSRIGIVQTSSIRSRMRPPRHKCPQTQVPPQCPCPSYVCARHMLNTCNTWWWRGREDAGVCQPLPRGATDADPSALRVCARACEQRENKSPFWFQKGAPTDPLNPLETFLLLIYY
jgi:hypothetical protein